MLMYIYIHNIKYDIMYATSDTQQNSQRDTYVCTYITMHCLTVEDTK